MGILDVFKKKGAKEDEEIISVFPEEIYRSAEITLQDALSPAALEITPSYLRLGSKLARTIFVFSYPRYLHTNWFSPIINVDKIFDVTMYVHPVETALMLRT